MVSRVILVTWFHDPGILANILLRPTTFLGRENAGGRDVLQGTRMPYQSSHPDHFDLEVCFGQFPLNRLLL